MYFKKIASIITLSCLLTSFISADTKVEINNTPKNKQINNLLRYVYISLFIPQNNNKSMQLFQKILIPAQLRTATLKNLNSMYN